MADKSAATLKQRAHAAPAVFPDALVQHYLEAAGCQIADPELTRLVSIELVRFLEDVVAECKASRKPSLSSSSSHKRAKISQGEEFTKLEAQDLEDALKLHKFQVSRAPFHPL
ncbi:hypothetical protein BASA81_000796 [Batrachochytrium salamandrivorans]|nr:hypothetical protein BASA81_000796 [Batrachochytrium salamandrivorans]